MEIFTYIIAAGLFLNILFQYFFGDGFRPLFTIMISITLALQWVMMWVAYSEISFYRYPIFFLGGILGLFLIIISVNVKKAEDRASQERRNENIKDIVARVLESAEADKIKLGKLGELSIYLRPFVSTNELPVQFDHGKTNFLIDRIDLENIIRLAENKISTVIALGRQEDEVLGISRYEIDSSVWKDAVVKFIDKATTIFLLPSCREGTMWEVEYIVKNSHTAKCVWIMPECVHREGWQMVVSPLGINWFHSNGDPLKLAKFKADWNDARASIEPIGLTLPEYRAEGLLFCLDSAGQMVSASSLNLRNSLFRIRKVRRILKELRS